MGSDVRGGVSASSDDLFVVAQLSNSAELVENNTYWKENSVHRDARDEDKTHGCYLEERSSVHSVARSDAR